MGDRDLIPRGGKYFVSYRVLSGSRAPPAFYAMVSGPFVGTQRGRGAILTIHLRLLPRSRKNGAMPLLLHTYSWWSAREQYISLRMSWTQRN